MPVFAWRIEPTRHFGEQPVPFASVAVQDQDKRWRTFSLVVDSGAVISLLCRSVADLLGVALETGRRVTLTGVGRGKNEVFVHELSARIGDWPERPTRFAISSSEDLPNLLGRLDVFDRCQVDFDVSMEETRFSGPWLDADGRKIWRHLLEVEGAILREWKEHPLSGKVDEAAKRFLNRADHLIAATAGLCKLHRTFELPLLIRSLFELSVQFEYLMRDAESRAALYLEFEHVTKHRSEQAWLRLPGLVGNGLRCSPLRSQGEAANKAEYDRVCQTYTGKKGVRWHWYPGTLRDLAQEVGRIEEYSAIYSVYSACAHGDPWTSGTPTAGWGHIWHALAYWARLLVQIADAKKIILTGDSYRSLVELGKGLTVE
jgi:hypothetical protein